MEKDQINDEGKLISMNNKQISESLGQISATRAQHHRRTSARPVSADYPMLQMNTMNEDHRKVIGHTGMKDITPRIPKKT